MDNLDVIIKKSKSWSDVSRGICGYKGGWMIKKAKEEALSKGIDFSHFVKVNQSEKLYIECPVCFKMFATKKRFNREAKKTCSHSCSNTYFRTKDGIHSYRIRAFRVYGNKCSKCGEDRFHVLEIHHKDKNRENNDIENLEVLCANCHLDTHYKDRSGIYGSNGRKKVNHIL